MKIPDGLTDFKYTHLNTVHFIGIGGAGMFPLAAVFAQRGCKVTGSDLTDSVNAEILRSTLDIPISIGQHLAKNFPKDPVPALVIHTSAVAADNPELECARQCGCPILRRGDALAFLLSDYQRVAAVSGSHGKTTITAMIGHILRQCAPAAGFIVGGKVNGWKIPSNAGNGDIFVTEADESDGSHIALHPFLGIVPNVEDDHAWSVGGNEQLIQNFKTFAAQSQHLIYIDSPAASLYFADHPHAVALSFKSISTPAFFVPAVQKKLENWADYQLANGALAVLTAERLGILRADADRALATFPGAARRMTVHFGGVSAALIEDYAHHPTELAAFLGALKKLYPGWRTQIIFQPHRYARLKRYIDEFASLLRTVDQVIVTPVFAAWVEKEGVDSAELARRIGSNAVPVNDSNWAEIAEMVNPIHPDEIGTVTAVVGAGDIDKLLPFLKVKF